MKKVTVILKSEEEDNKKDEDFNGSKCWTGKNLMTVNKNMIKAQG